MTDAARAKDAEVVEALARELESCEGEHPEFEPAPDEDELRRRALKNLKAGFGLSDDAA